MLKNKTVRKLFLTVFCFFACVIIAHAESCSSSGSVQYKPNGSCGTSQRTCCAATGAWSDWDGSCPSCTSNQCWNGSKCEDKPSTSCSCTNGTCTRTWTCTPGTGWSYTDGTCVCNTGYTLKNGKCEKNTSCLEVKSFQYYKATCAECWSAAKNMTNNVPKCTSDSSINCYVMNNPLGYESVSQNCDSSQHSQSESSGGTTSIISAMRYNHGLPSGTINCYFESLTYRTCI